MKTMYDVQQLLKRFGTFIYVGDRLADLELMEAEIRELQHSQLLNKQEFQNAMLLLKREIQLEKNKQKKAR